MISRVNKGRATTILIPSSLGYTVQVAARIWCTSGNEATAICKNMYSRESLKIMKTKFAKGYWDSTAVTKSTSVVRQQLESECKVSICPLIRCI